MHRNYTIILEPEEDGRLSISVPVLPGCLTWGDSVEDAIVQAKEAITAWVESARQHGEEVPEEHEPIQAIRIAVDVDKPIATGSRR